MKKNTRFRVLAPGENPTAYPTRRALQRGWTSIEILIGTVVVALFLIVAARALNLLSDYFVNKGVAHDALIVGQAANDFINANQSTVVTDAAPEKTYPLSTFASYLPSSFSQTTNAYGQSYELRVYQSQANKLDAVVVTTGGQSISDGNAQQVATLLGGAGGYVPSSAPATGQGAFNAWNIAWSNFGGSPGAGHVAYALFVPNAGLMNGYLYRNTVPGHPEVNRMNDASIDMNGNDLNNASSVNATTYQSAGGGQFSSDQGGSLELGGNNSQAGAGTPYIDFHLAGQGVQDYNTRVENDADGRISLIAANGQSSLKVQGTVQVGSIATPRTSCPGPGHFAANADNSGQSLECRYGQWMPIGGQELFQGFYQVANGYSVPMPTCPSGGTPQIQVIPMNMTIDTTATVNFGPSTGSGPWVVHITDGSGNAVTGWGIAETFCGY
ncbi:Type IV pilus biosynthesis protein [Paraburkholderia tropica]|uniref:shufflon system plasmid conjugative transfer pilus tip adhesin PilV n=1 Tax=Paraburkholderia tropica TaxID=92647 RepID=UPI001CB0FE74|nr:shufflon system plasmid conjugative transfer pilus tip adhesin PilV [Paraburkholderia tropica]CAG9230043.1 Type IV pilus biosynthesis protein [Paraburkholderia tropica]